MAKQVQTTLADRITALILAGDATGAAKLAQDAATAQAKANGPAKAQVLVVTPTSFTTAKGETVEMLTIHDPAIPVSALNKWNTFHQVSKRKAQALVNALAKAGYTAK